MALSETLDLDVAGALAGVDRVDAALTAAATSFGVHLADALDVLRNPPEVVVQADASPVTAAVEDAVRAADATIEPVVGEVQGAGAITEAVDEAVGAADTVIQVEADVGDAENAIAEVGSAAGGAAEAGDHLAGSAERIAVAAEVATGRLAALKDALPGGEVLGPVGVGVAAIAAGTYKLVQSALDADRAERQFTRTLGDQAEAVRQVDVGGLAGDLDRLAHAAGSEDEPLKIASARLFELGVNAGQSAPEVAKTVSQIDALALRAVALRPQLGEAGDVAERLSAALARGGRFAAGYGISLTSAEVAARALEIATARGAEEVTQFDKVAAGAAITIERLGDRIGTDFAEGVKSPEVQLKALRVEFRETLEALGKPLIEGVLREARAGQPILLDLARALAAIAEAALPLAVNVTEDLAPAFRAAADVAEILARAAAPVAQILAAIPAPMVSTIAVALALRPALGGLGNVFEAVGRRAGAFRAVIAEKGVAGALTGLVSPAGLAVVAVGALLSIMEAQAAAAAKTRREIRELTDEILKQEKAYGDIALAKTTDTVKTRNQIDDLNRIGLTTREVTSLALAGAGGFARFIDALAEGGEITQRSADLLKVLSTDAEGLGDALAAGADRAELLAEGNSGLVVSFRRLQAELAVSAENALATAQAEGRLSESQVLTSKRRHEVLQRDGRTVIDYAAVLKELLPTQVANIAATVGQSGALDEQAAKVDAADAALRQLRFGGDALAEATETGGAAFRRLVAAFLAGEVAAVDLNLAISGTKLTVEQTQAALAEAQAQQERFVDAYVQGVPKITGASAKLADDTSLDEFLADLHKKTLDEARFVANLAALRARGAAELANTFAEAGIEAASQAAKAAKLGDTALARREAQRAADEAINTRTLEQFRAFGVEVFRVQQRNLDRLAEAAEPDLRAPIVRAIRTARRGALEAADLADVGRLMGSSIGTGLDTSAPAIFRAAERAARAAKLGAIRELEIHSPSRVGEDIGKNFGLSMVLGLDGTHAAVAGAAARASRQMVLNLPPSGATAPAGAAATTTAAGGGRTLEVHVHDTSQDPFALAFAVDARLGEAAMR